MIFNSHHLYINKLNDLEVDYVLLSFSDEDSNTVKLIYDEYKRLYQEIIVKFRLLLSTQMVIFMINYHLLSKILYFSKIIFKNQNFIEEK